MTVGEIWEMNGIREVAEITDFAHTGEGTLHFLNSGAIVERRSVGLNLSAAPVESRQLAGSSDGTLLWRTEIATWALGGRGETIDKVEEIGRAVEMRDGSFLLLKKGGSRSHRW